MYCLYIIYIVFGQEIKMSENRLDCIKKLKDNSKCYISVVMKEDFSDYISPNHPLH